MKKVYATAGEALEGVLRDGMTVAAGGFGLCGIPELLIAAIRDAGTKDLTMRRTTPGSITSAWACCCKAVRSAR